MKLATYSRLAQDQARKHDFCLWGYGGWRRGSAMISGYFACGEWLGIIVCLWRVVMSCWWFSVFPFPGCACVGGVCVGGVCGWVCVFEGGGWLVGCFQSREFLVRFFPFEIYPPGKLQWHFTYGFHFEHGLWLPFVTAFAVKGILIVPVGNMGPFEPGDNTFQTFFLRKQREHAPRRPRFILNHFHNILRLVHVLPNFPLTTGESMHDFYL